MPVCFNAGGQVESCSSISQEANCKVKSGKVKLQGFANLCSKRLGGIYVGMDSGGANSENEVNNFRLG